MEALQEWSATPRYVRDRLLALGVPSELRIVTDCKQLVFPKTQAVNALRSDDLFQCWLHPDVREYVSFDRRMQKQRREPKKRGEP